MKVFVENSPERDAAITGISLYRKARVHPEGASWSVTPEKGLTPVLSMVIERDCLTFSRGTTDYPDYQGSVSLYWAGYRSPVALQADATKEIDAFLSGGVIDVDGVFDDEDEQLAVAAAA